MKAWKKTALAMLCGLVATSTVVGMASCGRNSNSNNNPNNQTTVQSKQLTQPVVSIHDGVATWASIAGAEGYVYKIDGGQEVITLSRAVVLEKGQKIQVKALGDGSSYTDSDWSAEETYVLKQLSAPMVRVDGETLSWLAVNNATAYVYRVNGGEEIKTNDTSVALKKGDTAQVKALGDDKNYLDSDWSKEVVCSFESGSVEVETEIDGAGTTTGGGVYTAGETVTVTAQSNPGYVFDGWYGEDNQCVSNDKTYTFTATGKKETLTAKWQQEKDTYTFTVSQNVAAGGVITGTASGSYAKGTKISLTAATYPGFIFKGWYEKGLFVSDSLNYQFDLEKNTSIEARWEKETYTITTLKGTEGGSVIGGGIYQYADWLALSATTDAGYRFDGWYKNDEKVSSKATFAIQATANETYTAKWTKIVADKHIVSVEAGTAGGSVSGNASYEAGAKATVVATTNSGYTFDGWYENGTKVSSSESYTFTVSAERTLVAKWTKKAAEKYTISATAGTAGGTVSGGGTFEYGEWFLLTATTNNGYTFDGWYDGTTKVSNDANYALQAVANKTYVAKWTKNADKYTITVSVDTEGAGTVSGGGTYEAGKSVTVVAESNVGYTFAGWFDGDVRLSSNSSYTFTATANKSLTAKWTITLYRVSVEIATAGGSVSGAGLYEHGDTATLKAMTNEGYIFLGWYDESDVLVESSADYYLEVTKETTLRAKWKQEESTVVVDTWRSQQGYNYFYYTQLGTDVMPIGAWSAPPAAYGNFSTNQITLSNYQTLAASGINAAYGLYDVTSCNDDYGLANILKALDYAEQVGIVYMVRDTYASQMISSKGDAAWAGLEDYMSKPAYAGTLLVDEPGYSQFSTLGKVSKTWQENEVYGENTLAYVNLLPTYASAAQLYYGATTKLTSAPVDYTKDYEGYVRAYMNMVNPQVFSYDFYPFNGNDTTILSGYFENMSIVRKVCMEYNTPFWTFQQVGAFDEGTRVFSYAELAVQANASLAYGAKGIQWFNYWYPLEMKGEMPCGLVDHYGNKTVYYDYVQKVNKQIAAVDHVLMKSKSTGIVEIGSSALGAIPARDKVTSYGAMTSATGGGNAIVGCFEYRDNGYAYYVSSTSTSEGAVVTLNFDGVYNLESIQNATSSRVTANSITLNVPAGEGVLVVVPKEKATGATYNVSVENTNISAGTALGAGKYAPGSTVTLAALPNLGYLFDGWYDGATKLTSDTTYTFTVQSGKTYTAKWAKDTTPIMLNDCEKTGTEGSFMTYTATNELSSNYVKQGSHSIKVVGPSTSNLMVAALSINGEPATRDKLANFAYLRMDVYADLTGTDAMTTGLKVFMIDRLAFTLQHGWNEVCIPMAEVLAAIDGSANSSPKQLDAFGGFYLVTYAPGTMYIDNIRMEQTGVLTPLSTPSVSVSTAGVASWSAVSGATGYKYKINGGAEQTTTGTSVQLNDGDSIQVLAIGDGETTKNSDYSTAITYTAPPTPKTIVLNDCEQAANGAFEVSGATLSVSNQHVEQGSSSVKMTTSAAYAPTLIYLMKDGVPLTRDNLVGIEYIEMTIYAEQGTDFFFYNHNMGWLFAGQSNTLRISGADFLAQVDGGNKGTTFDPYSYSMGYAYFQVANSGVTLYFDNVVAYGTFVNTSSGSGDSGSTPSTPSTPTNVVLNNCESVGGWVEAINTPTLSTSNVFEGSHSIEVTFAGWSWFNVRLFETAMSLDQLKATYSTISFNVYSSIDGLNIYRADQATSAGQLSAGNNVITLNTSDLTSTDFNGSFLTFFAGGASTIRIDNVVGTTK